MKFHESTKGRKTKTEGRHIGNSFEQEHGKLTVNNNDNNNKLVYGFPSSPNLNIKPRVSK